MRNLLTALNHLTVSEDDLTLLTSNKNIDKASVSGWRSSSISAVEVPVIKACKKYLQSVRSSSIGRLFNPRSLGVVWEEISIVWLIFNTVMIRLVFSNFFTSAQILRGVVRDKCAILASTMVDISYWCISGVEMEAQKIQNLNWDLKCDFSFPCFWAIWIVDILETEMFEGKLQLRKDRERETNSSREHLYEGYSNSLSWGNLNQVYG